MGGGESTIGDDSKTAGSFLRGKIGLALSGGGFRASLFHIGVIAKLAELDVLRHVEVLSCVSGGSILGAYYYLELRNLLQKHTDSEITREHYIELVRRLRVNFLAGVQRNIRLRMLLGWPSNARVLLSRRSSSSDRLAILYEEELYARVEDGEQHAPRYIADLMVAPLVETKSENGGINRESAIGLNPRYDNWKRLNKVPALILNATSLNSCHNWQFTASFMGEPPARSIDAEIDANHRMRRMYHSEAPTPYRRSRGRSGGASGVRLGEAVAASACVPGLFDPLVLDRLYGEMGSSKEQYVKRLVDGGNYDNQGIASLREQDCTVLIVSDACGRTGMSIEPPSGHLPVLMRANDILMTRSREAQYQLLSTLSDSGAIRGIMYLHLKKGLQAQVVDWVECDDPSTYREPPTNTDYGIRSDVQRLLASIRTDLDSFSWLESDALMLSGYLMAGDEWSKCLPNIQIDAPRPVAWDFRKLEPIMAADAKAAGGKQLSQLKTGLQVADKLAFKPFKPYPKLHSVSIALGVLIVALIVWRVIVHWSSSIPHAGKTIAVAVLILLLLVAVKELLLDRLLHYRNSYLQIVGALFMCTVGWVIFYPYLLLIDPLYVKWGSDYRRS